jgi:hypothetical protein
MNAVVDPEGRFWGLESIPSSSKKVFKKDHQYIRYKIHS